MPHVEAFLVELLGLYLLVFHLRKLLVVGEELEVVNEDAGRLLKGGAGRYGTVGYDFELQFLIVSLLLDAPVLHAPVDLADGSVDGVHRNGSDGHVVFAKLVSRHKAASLGDDDGDFELDGGFERADMLIGIQHLERRQSF